MLQRILEVTKSTTLQPTTEMTSTEQTQLAEFLTVCEQMVLPMQHASDIAPVLDDARCLVALDNTIKQKHS